MTRGAGRLRFVLFDYGNTLVPWGRREAAELDAAIAAGLARWIPGSDPEVLFPVVRRVKEALLRTSAATGIEATNAEFVRALAREAGGDGVLPGMEQDLERRASEAFVRTVRTPRATLEVLDALAARRTLGLLSNFYLAPPLHRCLEESGIRGRLAAAVVSGEIGRAKPHPEAFRALLGALGARPEECVFVGDNLRADVAGAAALGMRTVRTREWLADALFLEGERSVEGALPDRVVDRLTDLPAAVESLGPA